MALAVKHGFNVDQMDAVTAFLQGNLSEEIYMEQPDGFNDRSGRVCRLKKTIYGLKQNGREWNKQLKNTLKSFGLKNSRTDPCIYFTHGLILGIYVDDIIIFWKDVKQRDKLKASLNSVFKMKDMGQATNCIGLQITYEDKAISLDQSSYIKKILERFNMSDCKPCKSPSDTNQKLSLSMCANSEAEQQELQNIPYQEAVGSLLYLAQGTRPDIAFAVNDVSRFNSNFGKAHWTAVKRIFRYLKGTIDWKLRYEKSGKSQLTGFSDADWASDVDKRRSCTGYVFKLSNGAISWSSKRQLTVALSSTEAEYLALSAILQEAIWLKNLGQELDSDFETTPIKIRCDNQSALALAKTDGFRARSKHIDVRHHYICDKLEDNTIDLEYIPTKEMVADSLTKAVPGPKNIFCPRGMGIKN